MLNSQSNPKGDGSNLAINESISMSNKAAINNVENIDDKKNDVPRKYGISNIFRNLVCCSCFTSDHNAQKYKAAPFDQPITTKDKDSKINKKKKNVSSKSNKYILIDNAKIKSQDPNVNNNNNNIGSSIAQTLSASNENNVSPKVTNDDNSSTTSDSSQFPAKTNTENEKLLSTQSERNQNKKCFIIDLDETLVHSSFKYVKTADINVNVDIDGVQHEVYVCKRPFVDEFLQQLGHLFECVLFTASLGKYADPVTNFLDPDKVFESRLFREACAFKDGNYVKDLDILGRDIDSIVILDNSPVSYLLHPRNAVQIVSWFDDPNDTALRDLIPYFKDLANSPLSVPEWLEQNKPPESAGVLGYPPSNLHWILMQTLSVSEAIVIYQQRLRESYHASGSSNVSRQSSTRGGSRGGDSHELHVPHHGLITQAIKANRRKSLAAQEDESNRPPVSSPVAKPSSDLHLDDNDNDNEDDNDDDDEDDSMGSLSDHENANATSNGDSVAAATVGSTYHHSSYSKNRPAATATATITTTAAAASTSSD